MSNDEGMTPPGVVRAGASATYPLDYDYDTSKRSQSDLLPTPTGIGYWRKALTKFCLLAFGFLLLVCLACLLLGTRT